MANTFESISTEMLDDVGGGAGASLSDGHRVTAPAAGNDQLLSSLNGIQSSLNDLGKRSNSGSFLSGTNGVMFMGMAALAMSRRQQTTVVYGGRGSYYWQSSW